MAIDSSHAQQADEEQPVKPAACALASSSLGLLALPRPRRTPRTRSSSCRGALPLRTSLPSRTARCGGGSGSRGRGGCDRCSAQVGQGVGRQQRLVSHQFAARLACDEDEFRGKR